MFKTRLMSGIVLVLAAIVVLVLGNWWLFATVFALSTVGIFELLRACGLEKEPLAFVAYIGNVGYYLVLGLGLYRWITGMMILVLISMLIVYVLNYPKYEFKQVSEAIFSFLYVGVLFSFIYQTRGMQHGNWLVWLIIIGAWGCDTCAYVIGKMLGKHHLSQLSPKKTWEGCLGGVLGAGLLGFCFACFFPYRDLFIFTPKVAFPLIIMVSAVISQFGDLTASAIKRNYEIKDYGKIIPGHGGILDRFDSVIFVAPFVYYLLVLTSYIHL